MVSLGDLLTGLRRDRQIDVGAAKADIRVARLLLREAVELLKKLAGLLVIGKLNAAL